MSAPDDPVRLSQAGSVAPEALRNALHEGDALPTSSQLDSLASKLGPLFGAAVGGAAVGVATSSATAGSVASGGAGVGLGAKVVVGIALAGALAGGGVWLAHRGAAEQSQPKAAPPAAMPGAAAAPGAVSPPLAREQQREPRAAVPAPGAPSRAAAPNEAALLDTAQSVLSTNPERALALTRAHRQRFPNGALAQEREVIAIEALSRLGRKDEAKQRSEEFEQTYPGSAHRRKVESAVEP